MKIETIYLRKNTSPYKLLRYLATGTGVLLISSVSPLAGANLVRSALGGYLGKNNKIQRGRLLRDLKNMQDKEMLDFRELPDGTLRINILDKGKEKMMICKLDEIELVKSRKWDGKWRVVIFDIPHTFKPARDALRQKLSELGFYAIQKSVFIVPYPCEEEIDFIASVFNVRKYIMILYVSQFDGDEKMKRYFGI